MKARNPLDLPSPEVKHPHHFPIDLGYWIRYVEFTYLIA